MMSFFTELKRRNVFRVGFAYAIAAWVLLQVVDLVLENIAAPDWVMKVFMLGVAVGFPVSVIIAWAFEITPEGIKRESQVDRSQSIVQTTRRKLDRIIIGFLAVAVVFLLIDPFEFRDTAEPVVVDKTAPVSDVVLSEPVPTATSNDTQNDGVSTDEASVAVLPFVNMSSDPEQEFFSDGISEEILNVLTRIPNLKVAARTSSFQFKGRSLDIAEIGRQLRVNHILEGSVRKSGSTLRITTQLIEAQTGFHLWSKTFDRKLEDVFAIQDEIAATIATELETRLTPEQNTASTPVDLEAYGLYLKARTLVAARSEPKLFEAINILKAAIEIENEYAPAMATLAKAYAVLPWFSDQLPVGEAREQARQLANKALDIDPDNAEALSVLGIVFSESDMNWAGATELLDRALKANPGSVAANNFRGDLATRTGDFENALKYESRAAELDPLGPVQLTDLANVYLLNGDYQEVIRLANRTLELDQTFFSAYRHLIDANFALGDMGQLESISRKLESMSGIPVDITASLSLMINIGKGNEQQAQAYVQRQAQLARSGEAWASGVANLATVLGDFDLAGEMLLQAYREKDGTWSFPGYIRLPEQAPDSETWQEFWNQPGVAELVEIRRGHGLNPIAPGFGDGVKQ
jgi:TolB-like protein/Tfp pilus assembly protein PilF